MANCGRLNRSIDDARNRFLGKSENNENKRCRTYMPNSNDRYVVKHPDGGWAVKSPKSNQASGVFYTQRDAIGRAKNIVSRLGGGEVRIQGRDGRWRDSDTIPPGNDPFPPRDTRH